MINSITELHLVGISTESSTVHGSMNIERNCFIAVLLLFLNEGTGFSQITSPKLVNRCQHTVTSILIFTARLT